MSDQGSGVVPSTTSLGSAGEDRAVGLLETRGYRVVDRNVQTGRGEVDVIAWEGDTLCFVEVKARTSSNFGGAHAAVDARKQARLWMAAEAYLASHAELWSDPPECRFDVVTLTAVPGPGTKDWKFELFRDAFQGPFT